MDRSTGAPQALGGTSRLAPSGAAGPAGAAWIGLSCHTRMCAKLLKAEGRARGGRRGARVGPGSLKESWLCPPPLLEVSNSKETENLSFKKVDQVTNGVEDTQAPA